VGRDLGTSTSATEWTLTQYDWLGRPVSITYPDSAQSTNHYNVLGQLEKSVDPDGVITLFGYDDEGRQIEQAIDINQNSQIDPGTDRVRYQEESVVDESSVPWITVEQGWRTSGSDIVEQIIQRSPNGLIAKNTLFGALTVTTTNLLNQYTSKENQGVIDVTGTATTASIVTVNEQPTTRLDEYFAGTASGDNSASAIEITANIHAVNPGAGPNGEDVVSTATKSEIVPPEEEAFTYDDDGNLTTDGKWTYTWDAENRLIAITPKSGDEALIGKKLTFGYDTDAKRIWQDIADWNAGMI